MMPAEFNHANEEQLENYSLGRLPESEVASIEEHLLICESCRVELDATEAYLTAIRAALRKGEEPSKFWRFFQVPSLRWALVPITALVLLGVAGTQFLKRGDGTPAQVQLYAMRSDAVPVQEGTAGRPLDLLLDARGLPSAASHRMQLVDLSGHALWDGTVAAEQTSFRGLVNKRLDPGTYFVRIYGDGPEALREYTLAIR